MEQAIPALIANNQMRQRDERFKGQGRHKVQHDGPYDKQPTMQGAGSTKRVKLFRPEDFRLNDDNTTCICPAGQTLHSPGSLYTTGIGLRYQVFTAKAAHCQSCKLRGRCLPSAGNIKRGKQVTRFEPRTKDLQNPSERMRSAIDSVKGRQLYSQRIGTVAPVFGNIRHNKGLNQLNLRGRKKINAQ